MEKVEEGLEEGAEEEQEEGATALGTAEGVTKAMPHKQAEAGATPNRLSTKSREIPLLAGGMMYMRQPSSPVTATLPRSLKKLINCTHSG